ncbi:MAG: urease accessory UreF family protein [Pseudomonadota bacterium]
MRWAMPIDPHLITLTQWLSPSFPVGAFAYSHGLEAAVADGWVEDGPELEAWLRDVLRAGSGRCDAVWLRLAAGAEDLPDLNAEAVAFAPSAERRLEAERQGAAFVRTVGAVWGIDLPDVVLPVAVGAAAGRRAMDLEMVVPLYLHAMVSNLVAAAQRLMPLGQTQAQGVLAALHVDVAAVTEATRGAGLDAMESHAFLSDIAAMRHERQEPRIFQS